MALEAAGVPIEANLFAEADFTAASGYQAMQRILPSGARPTALFAGNDTIAMGAMLALREAGLSVPEMWLSWDTMICPSHPTPVHR